MCKENRSGQDNEHEFSGWIYVHDTYDTLD